PQLRVHARFRVSWLGVIGFALWIFVRQNDLGSSLLFFVAFMAILWIGSGKAYYPVMGLILVAIGVYIALHTFGHVAVRFDAWLHPYADPEKSGYQILQGQYAMAD